MDADTDHGERVAARLLEARRAHGWSTRTVVDDALKKRGINISHATLANYEKNKTPIPIEVLSVLATLYERPVNWFLEGGSPLVGIRYRHLTSKVRVKDKHRFELEAQHWLEGYKRLEEFISEPLSPIAPLPKTGKTTSGLDLAKRVRQQLEFGPNEPVYSVVQILEYFGVRTIELPTKLRIDGLAALMDEEPVCVLNPDVPGDRTRLNAGHELGHLAFGDCVGRGKLSDKARDDRAFEFGFFLLMPLERLEDAFTGRSAVRLVRFREKFGVSMAAMVYQAEKRRIINAKAAKWLWMEFQRRGWRSNDPGEPGNVRRDRAVRFEQILEDAINTNQMTWQKAESLTGFTRSQIEERLDRALGTDEPEEPPAILKLRKP